MLIDIPDNIFSAKGYLGHTFSQLEAIADLQYLLAQENGLPPIRKLAFRWGWKRTKANDLVAQVTDKKRTKSGQKTDKTIYENQQLNENERTKNGQKADKKRTKTPDFYPTNSRPNNGTAIPPTIEEVAAYIAENNYTEIDATTFWQFYESKGWMIGKNKMKNWHMAINTWRKRRQQENGNQHQFTATTRKQAANNAAYDSLEQSARDFAEGKLSY